MSDIRFNQWLHQSGTGGVSQDHIGNIGIGTTNPSIVVSAANTAVLNVGVITANNLFVNNAFNGDITGNVTGNISGATGTFSGNVDIADKIIHTGDTDTAMRFPADNTFAVDTAGSERLRITSDGDIGIGTDTPYANNSFTSLSIGGSGKYGLIELNKSDGVAGSWIDVYGTNGNGDLRITTAGTSGAITFWTGGSFTEKFRIDSNGNARLGPGGNNTNSTNYSTLTLSNQAGGVIEFLDSGNNNIAGDIIGAEGSGMYISSKQDTPIIFRTGATNTEKLRITSAGLVGIGTDIPSGKLNIVGSDTQLLNLIQDSGDLAIRLNDRGTGSAYIKVPDNTSGSLTFETGGSERLRITSGGDLLLGTTSNGGGNRLYVVDNFTDSFVNPSDSVLRVENANTSGTTTQASISLTSKTTGSNADSAIVSQAEDGSGNSSLQFWTDSSNAMSEKLRITSGGSVVTPVQPRFLARLTANTSYDPSGFGNHVDFDTEDYDVGGNFTSSGTDQGLFTAPVTGMYAFSAASYAPGTNQTQSWFTVNNSRKVATDWVPNQQGSFVQNFQIIYLSTGDKVGFHPHAGGTGYQVHANTHHTYFKGCLLG